MANTPERIGPDRQVFPDLWITQAFASAITKCLVPRGVLYFTTKLANFIMSVLNNQKELGGHELCPMGLISHPVDCRTLVAVTGPMVVVKLAPKLGFLRRVLAS